MFTTTIPNAHNSISGANGNALPPIKPINAWTDVYKRSTRTYDERNRSHVSNIETARKLVKSLHLDVGPPKTIVQAYPGPGVVSRALLELPPSQVERLIILEGNESFFPDLKGLCEVDGRASLIESSAFHWHTYAKLDESGLLSHVPKQDWTAGPSTLRWLAHLPDTVHSEQLISQLIRYIPERVWLWAYGRVQLDLLLSLKLWNRIVAKPKQTPRCRLSIVSECLTDVEEALPREELAPVEAHIYHGPRPHPVPVVASRLIPKESSLITQESSMAWDFVTRNLFVQRKRPLNKSIRNLSPGATVLLDKLSEVMDINKDASSMSVEDFDHVVKALQEWPFAPEMSSTVSVAELRELAEESG